MFFVIMDYYDYGNDKWVVVGMFYRKFMSNELSMIL